MVTKFAILAALIVLSACTDAPDAPIPANSVSSASEAAEISTPQAPPPPKGDARGESAAEPAPAGSQAEAAAALASAKAYFAHLEARRFEEAWAQRWKGEGDGAASKQDFIDHFAAYQEYRATVGNPGPVEGAAGSLYVDIPVQLYGRDKDGKPFGSAGTVTLRRVNDVPGSSPEQRQWRIYSRD